MFSDIREESEAELEAELRQCRAQLAALQERLRWRKFSDGRPPYDRECIVREKNLHTFVFCNGNEWQRSDDDSVRWPASPDDLWRFVD